jgi:HSP20 family molecular chaperone IbpA
MNQLSKREESQETAIQQLTPPVDVLENTEEYLLMLDIPGASAEGMKIELHNGELTIRAPISGRGVDLFSGNATGYEHARRFRAPAGIQGDKIRAELNSGVLKLHLPKEEAKKPRQIPVAVG